MYPKIQAFKNLDEISDSKEQEYYETSVFLEMEAQIVEEN